MPSKERSPNYPTLDLGEAIRLAKALYKLERRARVAPAVAVKAWGYSGLNGSSRTKLAALKQYGLLDQDGEGVRISDRGYTLSEISESSPHYRSALRSAALAPDLFRELQETHLTASDENLKYYLVVTRKFTSDGAAHVADSFRRTMMLAGLDGNDLDQADETPSEASEDTPSPSSSAPPTFPGSTFPSAQYGQTWTIPVSRTLNVDIRFSNANVSPADLERLIRFINLFKESLSELEERGDGLSSRD